MASKTVLAEAIVKLKNANMLLMEKKNNTSDKSKIEKYYQEIAKNEAMILDYNFRLQYDE